MWADNALQPTHNSVRARNPPIYIVINEFISQPVANQYFGYYVSYPPQSYIHQVGWCVIVYP